jgi:Ca-activated chloride channel family protein
MFLPSAFMFARIIGMHVMTRFAGVFALVALACFSQDSRPIRVNVRLVNVSFSARDTEGRLVTSLAKEDMEAYDDGEQVNIAFFAKGTELPLRLGLVVDASGSQERFFKRHERDLQVFLTSVLRPADRAFLLCFGNRLRLVSDFSASPGAITDGLKRFDHDHRGIPEIGPPDRRISGTAFYDAIYYATTEKLAGDEHGRRALIVLSDGEDNSSARHMLDAIEAAQRENVVVYAIRYTDAKRGEWTARNKYGMRVMQRIARETGGSDFDADQTDLKDAFRLIGEELRSSYELAYHSAHPGDGTFHKLVLRSTRPGMKIRTKTGYFAAE